MLGYDVIHLEQLKLRLLLDSCCCFVLGSTRVTWTSFVLQQFHLV